MSVGLANNESGGIDHEGGGVDFDNAAFGVAVGVGGAVVHVLAEMVLAPLWGQSLWLEPAVAHYKRFEQADVRIWMRPEQLRPGGWRSMMTRKEAEVRTITHVIAVVVSTTLVGDSRTAGGRGHDGGDKAKLELQNHRQISAQSHRGKKVLPCHGLLELTHTARN